MQEGLGMVPWGTGSLNVPEILHELRRQQFKGNISCEFFGNSSKVAYISKSLEYYQYFIEQYTEE